MLIVLAQGALADDPPRPVVPVATIVVPSVQPLIVFADGSVSKSALSWQVVEPADARVRQEGAAAIIENPVPGTTYRLALIAVGDAPPFAFRFASITAPGAGPTPKPNPPPDAPPAPAPVVTPPTPADDRFGLTAWTRDYLASLAWTDATLAYRRATVAAAVDAAGAAAGTAATLQAAITAEGAALKAGIAADVWPSWKAILDPIQARIQVAGVKTPADLAQALADVAIALREGGRR